MAYEYSFIYAYIYISMYIEQISALNAHKMHSIAANAAHSICSISLRSTKLKFKKFRLHVDASGGPQIELHIRRFVHYL